MNESKVSCSSCCPKKKKYDNPCMAKFFLTVLILTSLYLLVCSPALLNFLFPTFFYIYSRCRNFALPCCKEDSSLSSLVRPIPYAIPWQFRPLVCIQLTSKGYDSCVNFTRRNSQFLESSTVRISCNLARFDGRKGCGSDDRIVCTRLEGAFYYRDLPAKQLYGLAVAPADGQCQFVLQTDIDVQFTVSLRRTLNHVMKHCAEKCYAGRFHRYSIAMSDDHSKNYDSLYHKRTDLETYPTYSAGPIIIFSGDLLPFFRFSWEGGFYPKRGNADIYFSHMMLGLGATQVRLGKFYRHPVRTA